MGEAQKYAAYVGAVKWRQRLVSFNLFSTKPPATLGIDVGTGSIRLVELDRDASGQWVLERCAVEPLPPGVVASDGRIEHFDQAVDAVKRLVKKSGTRAKNAVAALPPSAVIAKKIVLPEGLSETEIDLQIESEASQYIPFSLDEVSIDYYIMGPSRTSAGDEEVMIVAARKERVDDMTALMDAAGLRLKVLDVASFAAQAATERLIKGLPHRGRDAMIAMVHVGATSTYMHILRNGEVLFEREQPFGGTHLTQHIARLYGMTQEEAESKKVAGQSPDDYAEVILRPFMERLAQEMQSALQFFYNSTPYNKVDYILLSGGSASLPKLTEIVTQTTGAACLLANPFDEMGMGAQVQDRKLRRDAPAFLTACGLAMRRFTS